jgi:hypothetical protein
MTQHCPAWRKWPLALALLAAPAAAAEEARLPNGRRVAGALTLGAGRLSFTPAAGGAPISIEGVTSVDFNGPSPAPFRVGFVRRVVLRDGQQFTGELLGLEGDSLKLRTAWAGKLTLPRVAVASLAPLPGWRPLLEDDLTGGLTAWSVAGKPAAGPEGVALSAPGQALAYTLGAPLASGRVCANFAEKDAPAGARWALEARFDGKGGPSRLRVTVAGAGDAYAVEARGCAVPARRVARTPGRHRLVIGFTPTSLRVTCDNDVLWYDLKQGLGGTLRQIALLCLEPKKPAPRHGSVVWSACTVEQAVDVSPRPPGDDSQDELWLSSDDQLFGRIVAAGRPGIEIEGHFGKRTFPWADVQGCYFRRAAVPAKPAEGPRVRLSLRSGLAADPDVLEGVLTSLNAEKLTLEHAALGKLSIDRDHVRLLRAVGGGAK